MRVEPDWFIVFPLELSNNNSLEVAKIVSVDLSAGDHGEVTVHWYTPSSRKNCSRFMYGRGVWSADYVMQDNKRVADLGTESIGLACCTFRALNKSQKLPFGVWAAVERRVPTGDASLSEGGGLMTTAVRMKTNVSTAVGRKKTERSTTRVRKKTERSTTRVRL